MKASLLLLICLVAGACTSGTNTQNANAGNTAANSGGAAAQTATVSPTPANVNSAVTQPEDEKPSDDTAEFAGTVGITDKRNVGIKAPGVMNAVRTARHGNYDRVVFQFAGPELPGYHVEYIDKPVHACGSGNVVPLAGDAWLEVRFTDAQAHTPEGQATVADRERAPNLPIIKELKITCDFEGEVTWVLGVSSPNKYRVLELKNPTRLAVDIKHK